MTENATQYSGLMLHSDDHVALALMPLEPGDMALITSPDGERRVEIREVIPRYHKFTVEPLADKTLVIKGGEVIGMTTKNVPAGSHLHISNLKSARYGVN
ncbi:UxaA family hydrolase [Martelella sp. AMO21009]